MIKSISLLVLLWVAVNFSHAQSKDLGIIKQRIITDLLSNKTTDSQVETIVAKMNDDGSFKGINYSDLSRTASFPHGGHTRDLLDDREAGGVQHAREFRPDAGQPCVRQWREELPLAAFLDLDETRGFAELRGDLRDELVRRDAFGNRDFEALPNGAADRLRHFAR